MIVLLSKGIKYVDQGLYNNGQNRSQDKPTVIWKSDILEKVQWHIQNINKSNAIIQWFVSMQAKHYIARLAREELNAMQQALKSLTSLKSTN